MDHIENFEEICSTTGSNGVPSEFLKCKLFPFSLADKASRWLKSLPAGSLRTWDECRAAFLDHFYTKSKTAALRNKISSFQQYSGEAFCEAWERLKEYRRECPHHGFKDEQILGIFYDGVEWDYRNALNAASNGSFMTKTRDGAFELIENLASSSNNKSPEYDRSRKVNSVEAQKMDELTAKVNQLLRENKKPVNFVDESRSAPIFQEFAEDDDAGMQEFNYVSGQGYVQNRGFNPNYRSHPNLSYRSTNVENPQDQIYPQQGGDMNQSQQNQGFQKFYSSNQQGKPYVPNQTQNWFQGVSNQNTQFAAPQQAVSAPTSQDELKNLMQQLMVNQQKTSTEIKARVDHMYNDLNAKYEAVTAHVKKLDTQVAQTAEAIKRPTGNLPGKGEMNPRNGYVNAVELMSGKVLVPPTISSTHRKGKEHATEHQAQSDEFSANDGQVEHGSTSGTPLGTVPAESGSKISEHPDFSREHVLHQGAPAKSSEISPERVYVPRVPYPFPPMKRKHGVLPAKGEQNPMNGDASNGSRAYVNYVEDQGPNQSREHQAPPLQENRLELMMQQILDGQNKSAQEVNEKITSLDDKINIMNNELSYKLESLTCQVDFLDSQVASMSESKASSIAKKIEQNIKVALIPADEPDRSIPFEPAPDPQSQNIDVAPGNTQKPLLRQLHKLEDPGKFVVPCFIFGVDFEDSLCDSGSSVNLMSRDIAESLGIVDIQTSQMSIRFADASVTTSQGFIENLDIQIGDCLIPTDFQVVEMNNGSYMPLILGRPFLATAGAVVDLPNRRIVFSNIDKQISYNAISDNDGDKYGSCVAIDDVTGKVSVLPAVALCDKNGVNEVLDGDTRSYERKPKKVNKRDKPKREKDIIVSHITLTPQRRVGDTIEYKLKGKGMSRPFSKVKAIITPEFKEKGQAAMASMLSKVLQLNISDQRASGPRLNPPPPSPDPDKKVSNPHMDSPQA